MAGKSGSTEFERFALYRIRLSTTEHIIGFKEGEWYFLYYKPEGCPTWIRSHFARTSMSHTEVQLTKHADFFEPIDKTDLLVEFL